jgi:hypothetical protein
MCKWNIDLELFLRFDICSRTKTRLSTTKTVIEHNGTVDSGQEQDSLARHRKGYDIVTNQSCFTTLLLDRSRLYGFPAY